MNEVILKGILKNIQFSHKIKDIEFYKANLIVKRDDKGTEDLIPIKYKRFSNPHDEDDEISIRGNLRTFSNKGEDKTRVELFVFSYFDMVDTDISNTVMLDGNICKKSQLRKTRNGKDVIDFIVANNIQIEGSKHCLNAYIPCVAWGKLAKELEDLNIGTRIELIGQLRSREYKKFINDVDFEFRIAHEVIINSYNVIYKK